MGLTKATLTNLDNHSSIEFMFNPTEYTISKSNSWPIQPTIGRNVPQSQYAGGNPSTMTMELFFDCFEKQHDRFRRDTVRRQVDKLWEMAMTKKGAKSRVTSRSRPPICQFQWGNEWKFKAFISSLSVRYTLFLEDGTPVRATANVSFTEAEDEADQPGTNPTSYAEPGYKRREVQPYDTLASIAHQEYGDAGKWRLIADVNQLDDPLAIRPGQILAVPPLP